MATLTMQEYEAALFGDRFRRILELLTFLREFDLTKFHLLVKAVESITSAASLQDRVRVALDALKVIAEMTPGDADDRLVEMITTVLTPELLDVLARLVAGMLGGGATAQDVTITAADRRTAAKAAIPWAFLVRLALQIVQLMESIGALSNGCAAEGTKE